MKPLVGIQIVLTSETTTAAVCASHLERLGATHADDARDARIVLTDDPGDPIPGGVRVVFEQHVLAGGDLIASESTAQAAIAFTDYIGPPGGPPALIGCQVGSVVAGFCAVQAILAELQRPEPRARTIGVSPLRALSALKTILWAARANPDEWNGTHLLSRDREEDGGYRTADGRITLDFAYSAEEPWLGFVRELGLSADEVAELHPRWRETVGWGDDVDIARPVYERHLERMPSAAAVELIRRNGGSSVPFQTLDECLASPQSVALGLEQQLTTSLPWIAERVGSEPAPDREIGDAPLAGVRVVDFGVGGVGPFAGTLLAWLGADVVKVESPAEFILTVRPTSGGISSTYLALNQGKRSVNLNLKDPGDAEMAAELVAEADIVIENFRPGAMSRLGFDFEAVSARNPSIVYCTATGFGWDGPLAAEPCTDPHMQAFSGFAAASADDQGAPRRIRYYGFVDLVTSCVLAEAACAGLMARQRNGGAIRVQTSMLHAVCEVLLRSQAARPAPLDGLFATLDGHVALTCHDDYELARLSALLGVDSSQASAALARRQGAEWARRLGAAGIACARALHDDDAIVRRDLWDADILRELPISSRDDALVAGGPPWNLGEPAVAPVAPTPGLDAASLVLGSRRVPGSASASASSFWKLVSYA